MGVENFNFGSWIKQERLRRGISTRTLSSKIDRTPSYISQLERNVINNPKKEVVYRIVKVLKIENDYLPIDVKNFIQVFLDEEKQNFELHLFTVDHIVQFLKKLPIKKRIEIQKELLDSIIDEIVRR